MIEWSVTIRCALLVGRAHHFNAVRRFTVRAGERDLRGAADAGYELLLATHPEAIAWRIAVTRLTPVESPEPTMAAGSLLMAHQAVRFTTSERSADDGG
jgi:hypothetical protein